MPRSFVYGIENLTGGLNESAAEMIEDNQFAQLDNGYVEGPSLFQREGHSLLGGPHDEDILSIFLYDPDISVSGDEIVLLGCRSSIAKLDGTGITELAIADGRIYPDSGNRWWFIQYNDEGFMCQKGNGGVKRVYGSSVMEAGLGIPSAAPTVTNGGAGKKSAGKYRVAYRYYNQQTGARSNWSPESKEIDIADNEQLLVSDIGTSSNPQVNARQIGATYPDEPIIRLVGQINDNTTTTFYENALAPDDYGEAGVDVNGNVITDVSHRIPPDQAWALELHKERLFVLNKDGMYWSEAALMQSFAATSYLPVLRGTGLLSWEDHGLVIGTEGPVQILLGDTPSDWRVSKLSEDHPCPAGKSMAVGDGTLFWYTGENIVASAGGAPAILPEIERLRATLDSIPDAQKGDVVGETIPRRGWYVLSVPTDTVRKLIVYSYKNSRPVGVFPSGPTAINRLLRESATEERVYVAFSGDYNLYRYLTGTDDNGSSIDMVLRTKNFGYENQAVQKCTRRVNMLCPQTNGTLTIKVYHDGTLVTTRTGLSLNKVGWKRFNVSGSGRTGALVQIGLEYSGSVQLRIDQLQIEGTLVTGRRPVPA
jgi:hypothetical protein